MPNARGNSNYASRREISALRKKHKLTAGRIADLTGFSIRTVFGWMSDPPRNRLRRAIYNELRQKLEGGLQKQEDDSNA